MMPRKIYKKIETILLYFVIKKNLEISFQNGPEHETTSLKRLIVYESIDRHTYRARRRIRYCVV